MIKRNGYTLEEALICIYVTLVPSILVFILTTLSVTQTNLDLLHYENTALEGCSKHISNFVISGSEINQNNCNFIQHSFSSLEQVIHPGEEKFIKENIFFKNTSAINETLSIQMENIKNIKFKSCKEYVSLANEKLSTFYENVLSSFNNTDFEE
eukprot:snap_masked-scaffold_65-processed-gene-0.35-mRNA-1 protein AED:1.00 eAED:1.00 QI:0/-1/0/0/-1/1/1/0/153